MRCRQNQELERYSAAMLQDKLRLQEQADSLSQQLEAVLHDKFERKRFDADTPIDKTLAYLHHVIKVRSPVPSLHHCCSYLTQPCSHSLLHKWPVLLSNHHNRLLLYW